MYIYQYKSWPEFEWDSERIMPLLSNLRHMQGKLIGRMEAMGFDLQNEATLVTLTMDVIKSSEIEGEHLNTDQVRSSVARRLGMDISGLIPSDRHVDGMVDMLMDATKHFNKPLTNERLFAWNNALFPTGRSGVYKIVVGQWRDDSTGPMQVVSGALGREKVHFQAPIAKQLQKEMVNFIKWYNQKDAIDLVLKAGIAHLWFITLHPFDDGNGRMARALTDMLLAKSDNSKHRFYSMSSQIRAERRGYYEILEQTQKGTLDITEWLLWFFSCLNNALSATDKILEQVIFKHFFWQKHTLTLFNDRQKLMLNKYLDGFDGNLNSSKWAKICKCSTDTALRDITDLMAKDVLSKVADSGRSTHYEMIR
jgi:Fic family protein